MGKFSTIGYRHGEPENWINAVFMCAQFIAHRQDKLLIAVKDWISLFGFGK